MVLEAGGVAGWAGAASVDCARDAGTLPEANANTKIRPFRYFALQRFPLCSMV
jgi:hypothetical protein